MTGLREVPGIPGRWEYTDEDGDMFFFELAHRAGDQPIMRFKTPRGNSVHVDAAHLVEVMTAMMQVASETIAKAKKGGHAV